MSDRRVRVKKVRSTGASSRWRRRIFWTVLGVLAAGNAVLFRRQYPAAEQAWNESYDRALRAMHEGRDFALAEGELRKMLSTRDQPRIRVLLAICLQAQGKLTQARDEYLAVLAADPREDRARIGIAEMALADQNYDEAFRHLDLAIAEGPTPVDAYIVRAKALGEVGDIDGAIAQYRSAIASSPSAYEPHLAIGDLLTLRSALTGDETARQSAAGSYREAEALIKSRLAPEDRRQRIDLARAIAGQVKLLGERDLAEAVRQLRDLAAAAPEDPQPTILLGSFLHQTGKDVEAKRALEDAAARWPGAVTATALYEFCAETGETDLAIRTLEAAVGRERENMGLRARLVATLFLAGKVDEAAREVENAEAILPGDSRVLELRGDVARERARSSAFAGNADEASKQLDASLAAYRAALETRPHSPRLKKKVASQLIESVLAKQRLPGEPSADEKFARDLIEQVLRVNCTDSEALEWQARLLIADGRFRDAAASLRPLATAPQPTLSALRLLGVAASRTGDAAAAADAMQRVVDILAPRDPDGRRDARRAAPDDWCNAIQAAAMAGRTDAAVRLAREASSAWSESPRVAAALGAAALAQGDAIGAATALGEARTRFPADVQIRLLLAAALEVSGRIEDAAREFERAADETGSDEARMRYLEFLVRSGRSESAEQGYLALIAADPTNVTARLRLGDFYLAAKPPQREAALREYDAAKALAPSDAAPYLRIADLRIMDAKADPKAYAAAETAAAEFEKRAPDDPHVGYLRGKLALVGGRNEEAVTLLRAFTDARPDRAAGLYFLGLALRAAGRPGEAREPMERAARLSPNEPTMRLELAALHLELGLLAFQKDDFEGARQLFLRADQGGARNGVRLLIAGTSANQGNYDVSEKECRELLKSEPGNTSAMHLLAMLLLRKGTQEGFVEADDLYHRVLAADSGDLLAALGVATIRFLRGSPREALADYLRIYPRTNGNPQTALAICQCYSALGDLKSAVEFLQAEAAARPAAYDFPHLLGDFLVMNRQHEAAVDAYLEASRRAPKLGAPVLAAAGAFVQLRRYEDARKLLVEKQPGSDQPAIFAVALGDVLVHMGRFDEAQESLQRALALAPGHGRALYLLGRIAERQSKPAEAKKLYRAAVERGTADADCHARLAQVLTAEKDFDGARDEWRAALQLAPREPLYLNALALVLGREDARLDEAISQARLAAALAPEIPEVADTLGWFLYRAGKIDEAVMVLAPAADKLRSVPEVQFHTGMALSRAGRRPEARVHLDRALQISQTFEGADTARAELDKLR